MKLSLTVAYAIGATLQMASDDPDRPISSQSLANDGAVPKRFLMHVLRSLVTHGVLVSSRGPDGGYCLARPPSEITLLEIIDALHNRAPASVPAFPFIDSAVYRHLCKSLEDATESARRELQKLTLADLLTLANSPGQKIHSGAKVPRVRRGRAVSRKAGRTKHTA